MSNKMEKWPQVFIGSSSESQRVVEFVKDRLSNKGEDKGVTVIPWCDHGFFPPGQTFLDTLTQKIKEFDFGVFVFGPDDMVKSRGKVKFAPRDNVIFEYGLSMAQLGRERTFALVPSSPEIPVKVMSDLAGLKLWDYSLPKHFPNKLDKLTKGNKNTLNKALKEPCEYIRSAIKELNKRIKTDDYSRPGPRFIEDVYGKIDERIKSIRKSNPKEQITVLNLALDMEQTWGPVRDRMLMNKDLKKIRWHSVLINPDADGLIKMLSKTVSQDEARHKIQSIRETFKDQEFIRSLGRREVEFRCRTYDSVPSFHGFLINDTDLFISFCSVSNGKLDASASPYWEFRWGDVEAVNHVVSAFKNWFEYLWDSTSANDEQKYVWPLSKH